MHKIGILFDIDALGSGLYGYAAYLVFFEAIDTRQLAGCLLSDGDTRATLAGRTNQYCIAAESPDAAKIAAVKNALSASNAKGLLPLASRFLEAAQVAPEPLVTAARINAAGELVGDRTGWVMEAWKKSREKHPGSDLTALPSSSAPAREEKAAQTSPPDPARMAKGPDEMFCTQCGAIIKQEAAFCPKCGVAVGGTEPGVRAKSKTVAVMLAVFLGFWTWCYTYKKDAWKFWLNLGLSVVTIGIWTIVAWPWAIIESATRPREFFANFGETATGQGEGIPLSAAPPPPPAGAPRYSESSVATQRSPAPQSGDKSTDPKVESRMKQVYGLEYNEKGALYRGYCDDQFFHRLSSAEKCLGMVRGMKRKLNVTQMCVVPGSSQTLLILNTERRSMALKTSLGNDEAAKLVANIVTINGKQVHVYKGTFLVSLDRI